VSLIAVRSLSEERGGNGGVTVGDHVFGDTLNWSCSTYDTLGFLRGLPDVGTERGLEERNDLTAWRARCFLSVAGGVPPLGGSPSLALLIRTPKHLATDAYYQELLGTSVSVLLSQATPTLAFSDCSSAIKRTHHALDTLGPAVGHLQHGTLLLGI
jgi:hypothetical protein